MTEQQLRNALQVHRVLQSSLDEMLTLRDFGGLKYQTAYAVGEVTGVISRAKRLLEMEIDDATLRRDRGGEGVGEQLRHAEDGSGSSADAGGEGAASGGA